MKSDFKHIVYAMIIIGFVTFTFTQCSKHVVLPIFEQKPALQDNLIYQKTQEARIQANIEHFLEKLLGKNVFAVSVVTTLLPNSSQKISLEKTPFTIDQNKTTTNTTALHERANTYSKQRPSSASIRKQLKKPVETGFSFKSILSPVIDLPGFPAFTQETKSEDKKTRSMSPKIPQTLSPKQHIALENTQSKTQQTLLINETLVNNQAHKQSIQNIFVSIVIDKDYFSYLELDAEELQTLIFNVAGLNRTRGDQLTMSFAPFAEKALSWNYFTKKNKVWFEKLGFFYEKIKPILFTLILILCAAAIFFGGKHLFTLYKARQKRITAENKKQKIEEEAKAKATELSKLEEKRQALVQFAQSKPDHFNLLLNSWMEITHDEPRN